MDASLLGISSSIIDIDPAHLDAIDTQDLFIPDKFYVIKFEHPHNFGNLRLLKLSVNDVFDGFDSEPLNVPR